MKIVKITSVLKTIEMMRNGETLEVPDRIMDNGYVRTKCCYLRRNKGINTTARRTASGTIVTMIYNPLIGK